MTSREQKQFRLQRQRLEAAGYTLKHTPAVGWWVDGACGYPVAGYFDREEEAVVAATSEILEAEGTGEYPSWRTSTKL